MIETSTPWIGMQLRSTALSSLSATGPLERPRPSAHRHPSSHRVSAPAALIIIPPPPARTHPPPPPHPPSPTSPVQVWTDRSPLPSIRTPSPDRRPVPTNDDNNDRRQRHHQHRRRRHHENSVRQPTDAPPPFSSSSTADRSCCDPCPTIDTDGYMNEVARTAEDRRRLAQARLRVAAGGYYHGPMSSADARRRLADRPVGTFLVRDSSDRGRYPFAITVLIAGRPAGAGPASTSIRIVYESGRFRFDGVPETVNRLPSFECVVALIRHHVGLTTSTRSGSRRPPPTTETGTGSGGGGDVGVVAFVGRSAALSDESSSSSSTSPAGLLPVVLSRPLPVCDAPSALKHLCRRRISAALDGRSVGRLQLLPSLKDYLLEYPYDL